MTSLQGWINDFIIGPKTNNTYEFVFTGIQTESAKAEEERLLKAVDKYLTPDEIKDDFDWDLLIQLVAASFSSDGVFDMNSGKELPDFVISVQSGDQVVVKKVSELWGFQILRLFEIYIEEQMNLQILIQEDEKEKEAILAQRDSRLSRWKLVVSQEENHVANKQAEVEKEEKLDDLYSQL